MDSAAARLRAGAVAMVCGLLAVLAATARADSDDDKNKKKAFPILVEAYYTKDDNVARASGYGNVLEDDILGFTLSTTVRNPLSPRTRLIVQPFLGADAYSEFDGLSNFKLGLDGQVQFRSSGDFTSATWAAFFKLWTETYRSELRDSFRSSFGGSVQQPITDRIGGFVSVSANQRDGRNEVFDNDEVSLLGSLDYLLTGRDTFYLTADFRSGDFVSTAQPSLLFLDYAEAIARDDVFNGAISYKLEGDGQIFTFGYNRVIASGQSLDFSWRTADVEADGDISYEVTVYTLAWVAKF